VKSGGLTVSRTTGAGRRRARCSAQLTDRARLRPLSDVRVEPGDRVLTESPALWKFAGELEPVDGHSGQAGELHYLSYAEEFHVVLPVTWCCALSARRALEREIYTAGAKSHQRVFSELAPILHFFWVLIIRLDPQYSEEFPALATVPIRQDQSAV